jgi:dipeptide transport system substrate-binding protein
MKRLKLCIVGLSVLWNLTSSNASASTFVYCSEGSPTAFNPQITTDGTSNNAAAHTVYDRLVEFKYGTTEVVPSLASSWKVTGKGKIFTFTLRKGVQFHTTAFFTPTREMNADDVLFSFNRMRDSDNPYHKISGGNYEYWNAMDMGKLVKTIKKVDNYTVEITLNEAEAPFLANLAMSFMSVLSKEYADKLMAAGTAEKIDQEPVGTGPFIFKQYSKDTMIRFERNEKYFAGAPSIEKLVFAITPDPSVRYQKLKTGECHLVIEPAPADLEAMRADSKLKVLSAAGLNVGYLSMNTLKKPFDNLMVRKAVAHALNKADYINAIYLGNAIPAKGPLPPSMWGSHHGLQEYEFSPEKAKELLKKAGYPNGFEAELWTLPITRPYIPNGKKLGEMMQADLARIGIKVKLVSYDWSTYLAKARTGEHQMLQLGWTGDNGDPDNFLNVLLGCSAVEAGSNNAKWCHKPFNDLIIKAKRTTDMKARTEYYKQAQEIFNERVPWIPLAHSVIFRAMSTKVDGYKIDPLGGDIFKEVKLQ